MALYACASRLAAMMTGSAGVAVQWTGALVLVLMMRRSRPLLIQRSVGVPAVLIGAVDRSQSRTGLADYCPALAGLWGQPINATTGGMRCE